MDYSIRERERERERERGRGGGGGGGEATEHASYLHGMEAMFTVALVCLYVFLVFVSNITQKVMNGL